MFNILAYNKIPAEGLSWLLNKARDKYAYTLIGLKADVPPATLQLIGSIKGVLSARIILGAENKI